MATKSEIKRAILEASGNPSVGVIVEIVDDLAQAVFDLDNTTGKEARVLVPEETR